MSGPSDGAPAAPASPDPGPAPGLAALSLAALGVVYGDIGTSPLYAIKECFSGPHGVAPTPENVLGVLSLICWAMTFVISYKYISILLTADNRGEGGILALLALVRPEGEAVGLRRVLLLFGLFGAALLYGDGVITPVISVLGALEGISVATPALERYVIPLSAIILVALFLFQRRGTAGIGRVFGPVMIVWFSSIAVFGILGIIRAPSVLRAVNPWYAVEFLRADPLVAFLILGAVVLVITGGEALYADMGHFGRRPIRMAWFAVVFPALLLNYFGQGALLLRDAAAAENPFYNLVPEMFRYPMIVVSTSAAVVASQALISGAFSLTRQAVQLGYAPRVTIVHTSRHERGQIYIPEVNWALMLGCLSLVFGFGSVSSLAGAYGIAVTGTMAITTILLAHVARNRWRWPVWQVALMTTLFLFVDLSFFSANLGKIPAGGWFPLALGLTLFTMMTTWKRGRVIVTEALREGSLPIELFIRDIERRNLPRVPGLAVFMTADQTGAPPVLLHHLKHNKVLHEKVLFLSVLTREIPQVPAAERLEFRDRGGGFYSVVAYYGFMETPDVPAVLGSLASYGLEVKIMETSFYLGRETLIPMRKATASFAAAPHVRRLPAWRKRLFILMSNNARSATSFFGLPPNRVVELGAQVQI